MSMTPVRLAAIRFPLLTLRGTAVLAMALVLQATASRLEAPVMAFAGAGLAAAVIVASMRVALAMVRMRFALSATASTVRPGRIHVTLTNAGPAAFTTVTIKGVVSGLLATGEVLEGTPVFHRGVHKVVHLQADVRDPWGLVRWKGRCSLPVALRVPPLHLDVHRRPVQADAHHTDGSATLLRGWTPGDSSRAIAWRASARAPQLVVRDPEPEAGAGLIIRLEGDAWAPRTLDWACSAAVSLAATQPGPTLIQTPAWAHPWPLALDALVDLDPQSAAGAIPNPEHHRSAPLVLRGQGQQLVAEAPHHAPEIITSFEELCRWLGTSATDWQQ